MNLMAELERESHAVALALQTWPLPLQTWPLPLQTWPLPVGCLLAEAFLFSANFCVLRKLVPVYRFIQVYRFILSPGIMSPGTRYHVVSCPQGRMSPPGLSCPRGHFTPG